MSKEKRPRLDVGRITEGVNPIMNAYGQAVMALMDRLPLGANEHTKQEHERFMKELEELILEGQVRIERNHP